MVVTASIVVGCPGGQGQTVPINTADATPPSVFVLETLGRKGGEVRVTTTSGDVSGTLAADDSIALSGRVDDSEGVKQAALWGTTEKTCLFADGHAEKQGPELVGAPLVESTDPATSGSTTTQRVVSHPLKVSDSVCAQGSGLTGLKFVFWVTGQNWGVGIAQSATLTLTFSNP